MWLIRLIPVVRLIIRDFHTTTPPLKERSITVRKILEPSKQLRSEMILGGHVQNSLRSNSCPCPPHLPNYTCKTNHRISRGYFAFLFGCGVYICILISIPMYKNHFTNDNSFKYLNSIYWNVPAFFLY